MAKYSIESRVRYSEIDENRQLDLCSVINYFQDCSTFQSEDLGVGLEYLTARGLAWLMNSWQIIVDRYPSMGERIRVTTWATDFSPLYGTRNFLMEDSSGAPLARANSLWVYMDMKAGRPARIPEEMYRLYDPEPRLEMDYAPRKVSLPRTGGTFHPLFPVVSSNIDTNHHVNNGQYIKMAEDYLPEGFVSGQMRAEYKSSAQPGDMILPVTYDLGDRFYVSLCNPEQKPFTLVEFTRKDIE